jgi:hypothetical protein
MWPTGGTDRGRVRKNTVERTPKVRLETTWAEVEKGHHYRKHHSFVGIFKFVGTDEYIQIIFVGPKTDKYKLMFVGFDRETMNIWVVRFDFDRTHVFVGEATSPTNIHVLYLLVIWPHRWI